MLESTVFKRKADSVPPQCGSIPFLAREVLDQATADPLFLQVSLENTEKMLECVELHGKGVAAFSGLGGSPCVFALKDTGATNPPLPTRRDSVSIQNRYGRFEIGTEKYMKAVDVYKADIFHTLSDGDTPDSCPKKRLINAVDRTVTFFNECLEIQRRTPSLSRSMLIGKQTCVGLNSLWY